MKNFYKLESGNVNLEDLLSSRTYKNTYGFNKCIYCDKEVESDCYHVFSYLGQSQWVSPTRCDCDEAKKELAYKKELIIKLSELDNELDENCINNKIFKSIQEDNANEFESWKEENNDFDL